MKIEDSDWGIAAFFLMLAVLDNMTERGQSDFENNQRIFQEAIQIADNKGLLSRQPSLIRGADVLHAVSIEAERILKNLRI